MWTHLQCKPHIAGGFTLQIDRTLVNIGSLVHIICSLSIWLITTVACIRLYRLRLKSRSAGICHNTRWSLPHVAFIVTSTKSQRCHLNSRVILTDTSFTSSCFSAVIALYFSPDHVASIVIRNVAILWPNNFWEAWKSNKLILIKILIFPGFKCSYMIRQ